MFEDSESRWKALRKLFMLFRPRTGSSQGRLLGLRNRALPSPTEMSPKDDLDADLDVPAEIRRVINCVLQDSIRPAFAIFSGRRSTGREGQYAMEIPRPATGNLAGADCRRRHPG